MGQDPICIFGGAFDPIHVGHLLIAEDVRVRKGLARIVFVPCSIPPTKERTEAGAQDRLEMVRLAVKDNPAFEASDIEVKRGGISYTVDTLRSVREGLSHGQRIYLLMGMDQLNAIESWREPEEITKMCRILVVDRPGLERAAIPESVARSVDRVDALRIDVSSSTIRRRLNLGQSVRYMVTGAVLDYIFSKGLYGAKSRDGSAP